MGFKLSRDYAQRLQRKLQRFACAWLMLLGFTGCQPAADTTAQSQTEQTSSSGTVSRPLRVLVVNDENLGLVAQREWLAVSDSPLELSNVSLDTFREQLQSTEADALQSDVVIYPTAWLGTLAESNRIAPMPRRVQESELFADADILPWVRKGDVAWGETTYAVPLGSVMLTMAARVPQPRTGEDTPALPKTWKELQTWRGADTRVAHPLAAGWAGFSHLARAASYVRSRGQISTLFDYRTMQPLVDSPPFVRALEELAASAKTVPDQIDWTPWDVQQALKDGKCDVGLTWMSPHDAAADSKADSMTDEEAATWLFSEAPGAREVYRASEKKWSTHRDGEIARVPLIGLSGRVGSVLQGSRRQRAAWSFLAKMSADELSTRVSSASQSTGPFRLSHQPARAWVDRQIESTGARKYSVAVTKAYSRNLVLHALRIPGHEEYLAKLDAAVRSAIQGEGEPVALLKQVAEDWQQITESRGIENQRAAFARNLGMEP